MTTTRVAWMTSDAVLHRRDHVGWPTSTRSVLGFSAAVVFSVAVGVGLIVSPTLAIGIAALAAVAWAANAPRTLGATILGLAPAAAGLHRGLLIPKLRFSESLVLLVAILLLAAGLGRERFHESRRLERSAWVWIGASLAVGLLGAYTRKDYSFLTFGTSIAPLQFFLLYWVVASSVVTPALQRRAIRVFMYASVVQSAAALLELAHVRPVEAFAEKYTYAVTLSGLPATSGQGRAIALLGDWHTAAGYFVAVVLICAALLLEREQRIVSRRALVAVGVLALAGLLATKALGDAAGLAIGLLVLAVRYGRLGRWLFVLALVGALVAMAYGSRVEEAVRTHSAPTNTAVPITSTPYSIEHRLDTWRHQYLPAVEASPIVGYGYHYVPPGIDWQFEDSLYVALLIRGGVLLLLAFIVVTTGMFRFARRALVVSDPGIRAIAAGVFALLVALIPMQLLEPFFLDIGLSHVLWGLLGLLAAALAMERRAPYAGDTSP